MTLIIGPDNETSFAEMPKWLINLITLPFRPSIFKHCTLTVILSLGRIFGMQKEAPGTNLIIRILILLKAFRLRYARAKFETIFSNYILTVFISLKH